MATLVLGAAGAAIGGSIGGAILGVSAATIGGFIGSTIGSVVDSWIISSLAPTQRIEGARLDTLRITSATEGAVIPRLYGRMRMGGNIIWATDFREETKTTTQGGGKGGGGGKVKTTEYLYYASFAVALVRGPDHRHRPHLGRRQADGPLRRHLALVSGRRGADGRSVHRGEDGRGQHARLSRHGLCRLRGTGALDLRQPPAAAVLRGVPAARRSRHRRGADPRRHHDPGLGRVHLCHAGDPQDRRRRDGAREPERAGRLHRHGGGAGPAAGDGACGRERQPRRRLVRRRSARGLLQGAAGRRGVGQVDHARQLVGQWRQPRQCLSRQPRRSGPPRLWRHAVRLRRGAGDPGDEGARAARHLLSVHPDGRAARQHAAEPLFRQRRRDGPARVPLAGADHLFAGGGLRRNRGQDRHGRKPGRGAVRRGHARELQRLGSSRFRGPGRPATGVCGAWCCTTPISARRRAGSMPS